MSRKLCVAMAQAPRSYSTVEVAKRLGVSLQTVRRWVDAGHLKAWKTLGGHRHIDASSAERLFKEQEERIGDTSGSKRTPIDRAETSSTASGNSDPVDGELLVMLVQMPSSNATVEPVANGFHGFVVAGHEAPDLMITDLQMSQIDGIERLRSLVDSETKRPRVLIAVTAMSQPQLAELGQLPDNVLLFTKPLEQGQFAPALKLVDWPGATDDLEAPTAAPGERA